MGLGSVPAAWLSGPHRPYSLTVIKQRHAVPSREFDGRPYRVLLNHPGRAGAFDPARRPGASSATQTLGAVVPSFRLLATIAVVSLGVVLGVQHYQSRQSG